MTWFKTHVYLTLHSVVGHVSNVLVHFDWYEDKASSLMLQEALFRHAGGDRETHMPDNKPKLSQPRKCGPPQE